MAIELVRIDDRLIHGQIATTWINNYSIEQVLIINDEILLDKRRAINSLSNISFKNLISSIQLSNAHCTQYLMNSSAIWIINKKEQLFTLNTTDNITILAHSLQFIRNSVLKTWVSHWGH